MQRRRYPLMPFIVVFLKITAVVALVILGFLAIREYVTVLPTWFKDSTRTVSGMFGPQEVSVPAIKAPMDRLMSLLVPTVFLILSLAAWSLFWGLSDAMHAAREIEFRTRTASDTPELAEAPAVEETVAQ